MVCARAAFFLCRKKIFMVFLHFSNSEMHARREKGTTQRRRFKRASASPPRNQSLLLLAVFLSLRVLGSTNGLKLSSSSAEEENEIEFTTFSNASSSSKASSASSTNSIHSHESVFEGRSDTSTLQWTSNYVRRVLPRFAVHDNKTWEGSELFTSGLSWELIDDYSNGMMLLEFNKMPKVRNIDPSLKLFHYGLYKNGAMKKLVECDYEKKGEESECMGLERSMIYPRIQNWLKVLLEKSERGTERERLNGGHEYWTHTWLEHDMEDNNRVSPVGASFLEHSVLEYGRDDEAVDALKDYLEATGMLNGFSAEHEQNVRDVIKLATDEETTGKYSDTWRATTWLVAVMHSRLTEGGTSEKVGIQAIRLAFVFRPRLFDDAEREEGEDEEELSEDELPTILEDMADFLAAANWLGDLEEFERIGLYAIDRTQMGYTLQVDVLPKKVQLKDEEGGGEGERKHKYTVLGPNVGVEIAAASISGGFDALDQLQYAVEDGLIEEPFWNELVTNVCQYKMKNKDSSTVGMVATKFHACMINPRKPADKLERLLPNNLGSRKSPIAVALSHIKFGLRAQSKLFAKAYVGALPKPWWCPDDKKKPFHKESDDDYLSEEDEETKRLREEHERLERRTFRYKQCQN